MLPLVAAWKMVWRGTRPKIGNQVGDLQQATQPMASSSVNEGNNSYLIECCYD